jgi:hypothetical protein
MLEVFADGSWRSALGTGHPKGKRVAARVVDYRRTIPAALAGLRAIGSSPRSWIPSAPPRRNCRR